MKSFPFGVLMLVAALAGCSGGQDEQKPDITPLPHKPAAQVASAPAASAPVAEANNFTALDLSAVPVSGKTLGAFPYFDAPEGYTYAISKEYPSVEKYFFTQDGKKLIRVKGRYFIGHLEPKPNAEESPAMVTQSYTQAITAAGGVKLFEGNSPEVLRSEYSSHAPPGYWRDMVNPLSAGYTQYVINRGSESVWVELAVNPGNKRIDMTVIQQASAAATTASTPVAATASAAK